jgi:hypothetical protein
MTASDEKSITGWAAGLVCIALFSVSVVSVATPGSILVGPQYSAVDIDLSIAPQQSVDDPAIVQRLEANLRTIRAALNDREQH